MKRVVISGLGFITSIGNSREQVLRGLKECRTGVELFPEFDHPGIPVKLAGTVKGRTLTVTLAKAPESQPRQIAVQAH